MIAYDGDAARGAVTEPARTLPVARRVEVLVVGGGTAGVAAALAAARNGARTLVVERGGYLGGTGTAALMALYTVPYNRTYGICRELIDAMAERGGAVRGPVVPFEPEVLKQVSLATLRQAGVDLLHYTWVADSIVDHGHVRGVVIENKSGRQAILADIVIDASGDADVAARAGAAFVTGRETDQKMRPMTIVFRMGPVDVRRIAVYRDANPGEFTPDPGHNILDIAQRIVRIDGFFSIMRNGAARGLLDPNIHYLRLYGIAGETGNLYVNTVRIYGVDGTSADDLTEAQTRGLRQVEQIAGFLRAEIPGFADAQVLETAEQIGVRETRRIVGDQVLTIEDLAAGRRFSDAICTADNHMVPGVEIHSPDGGEGARDDAYVAGLVLPFNEFSVPRGCLLPRGLDGLIVAGRCLSTTHEGDAWTRGQPMVMQIGEGAGTLAAFAVRDRISPRAVDMAAVQAALRRHGGRVLLPGDNYDAG
jgi:ribulose 1,5-bisphosphate synthetase/thiazole synthase